MAKNKGFGLTGWLATVVILASVTGGGYLVWQRANDKGPDYKTALITRGDVVQLITATGQLDPKTNVIVGSQVSGIISRLYVDFNSPVTNGQVIAQLDPSSYRAMADQCEADVANSRAVLELAAANVKRSDALYKAKILAEADHDADVAAFHQAQAQVKLKEATLKQAQVNLAYTTIYSPVDGVVISRNVDVGQTVAASLSAPTLYQIANDLTKMQIDALVSEADIGGVETNQQVSFTVDAFPSRTFQGVVVQIRNAPQTNQNVITYDTVISVDNSDLKLRPGMTANVSIVSAQRLNVLKIPNSGLRFHPIELTETKKETPGMTAIAGLPIGAGGHGNSEEKTGHTRNEKLMHTVYLLGKDANGKEIAKPAQIKTGINDGIFTQVTSGLTENDEVIIGRNLPVNMAQSAGGNPFTGGGRR